MSVFLCNIAHVHQSPIATEPSIRVIAIGPPGGMELGDWLAMWVREYKGIQGTLWAFEIGKPIVLCTSTLRQGNLEYRDNQIKELISRWEEYRSIENTKFQERLSEHKFPDQVEDYLESNLEKSSLLSQRLARKTVDPDRMQTIVPLDPLPQNLVGTLSAGNLIAIQTYYDLRPEVLLGHSLPEPVVIVHGEFESAKLDQVLTESNTPPVDYVRARKWVAVNRRRLNDIETHLYHSEELQAIMDKECAHNMKHYSNSALSHAS